MTRLVKSGRSAVLEVVLGSPANVCRLVGVSPDNKLQNVAAVAPTNQHVQWRWRVPAGARGASWLLQVICDSRSTSLRLVIQGKRRGTTTLAQNVHVFQFGPAMSVAGVAPARGADLTPAQADARRWWARNGGSVLATFHAGASAGQCTDYVAARRPDIVARGDMFAYTQYLAGPRDALLAIDWLARDWPLNARRAGLTTGKVPQPGAVMVFQPGSYGASSPAGHVGVVDVVSGDGSFSISEMHAPVLGVTSLRNFDAQAARAIATGTGVTFIYR
jgi:surface antigen